MARCPECSQYIRSKRSSAQNRYYWQLMHFLWEHQDNNVFPQPENLHNTIKLCIGYTEPILNSKGEEIGKKLKSTNFATMGQEEFNDYFDGVQRFIYEHITPKLGEDFKRELNNYLRVFT